MEPRRARRSTLQLLVSSCALSAMLLVQNSAAFTIAQIPPFLPTPLPPNIVLTFDDSGSMVSSYVPDDICSLEEAGRENRATGWRRTKSSTFNSMYYDPTVTYERPFRYDAKSGSYVEYKTSFNSAPINGLVPTSDSVDLERNYRVTWKYDPSKTTSQALGDNFKVTCGENDQSVFARNNTIDFPGLETSGVRSYYYVYNADQCSSKVITDDACYRLVRVGVDAAGGGVVTPAFADERENFANWYSFYRTRNLMTASAAMRALRAVPATARVGWQALTSCSSGNSSGTESGKVFDDNCRDWAGNNFDKRLKIFDDQHRANLYSWLSRLPAQGQTPLRTALARAGDYYRTDGINSPYAEEPTKRKGTEHSCRPNFHVLMTDGIWNETSETFCSGAQCNNADKPSAPLTLKDGNPYRPTDPLTAIFRDEWSDSLADVSFFYWSRDLRPDLADNLQPYVIDRSGNREQQYWNPKNDPATWQHMISFTVGLGLTRSFTAPGIPWAGSTYAGEGYRNLLSGARTWPQTGANGGKGMVPGNVYDLWHAAINSRGQAFSADTPAALSDALATALNRILERESAAAAIATNSTRLATDTLLYQARFFSGTWTGALTAYAVNSDGSVGNPQWEASAPGKIPAHGGRKIFTWDGKAGVPFTEAGLTASGQWASIGSTALLDYLRGDKSNETPKGLNYRSRGGPLGDIVNSDPAYVAAENFGYSALAGEGSTYSAFIATTKKKRNKMLYVGSNAGFLHGFDAMTGEEVLAYVPSAVVPNLPLLAKADYSHRFYVDGSPVAYDAYFGGGWKTVLIGTTGAGGRSVFALDVTNPSSFAASNVLWEINQRTSYRSGTDAADPQYGARLGYTIGQAVVAKLNNGEWAAIFGNGYCSAEQLPTECSREASLYIVRMSDGALIKRIDTGVGGADTPNGLGTPTLYDTNGDEVYDAVYAADMRGNVWKFDLGAGDAGSWKIAFDATDGFPKGAPLFQARNATNGVQPISARIELASPPQGKSGIMVLFGTGRFFADGDNTDTTQQSFYGIWDNGSPVSSRSVLKEQTVSTPTINLRGVENSTVRTVSSNAIDWSSQRGWYLDLPTSMERVIGTAAVRDNRVIFTTLIPSIDLCEFGGSGWLMEVSATTGAQLPYAVFDTTADKGHLVNDKDAIIAGVPINVGMVKRPLVIEGTPTAAKFLSGSKGEIQLERNRTFGKPLGRESWREIRR